MITNAFSTNQATGDLFILYYTDSTPTLRSNLDPLLPFHHLLPYLLPASLSTHSTTFSFATRHSVIRHWPNQTRFQYTPPLHQLSQHTLSSPLYRALTLSSALLPRTSIFSLLLSPLSCFLFPLAPSCALYLRQFMTRYEDDESSSYPMTPQQARHNDRRRAADDIYITNSRDPYQPSEWLQREKAKSSKWRKIFLAVAIIIVAAIAGILAWYYAVHKKNQDNETIGKGSGINVGSGGPDKNGDGSGTVAKGDTVVGPNGDLFPNPNYKLKRVFYGMAYVPMSAQLPNCGATPESVAGELQLLAMSTRRVRLYGTDCNVLDYTLQAIKTHKLDLKVIIGIWIDNKNETFIRQEASMFESLKKHGWDNIIGISVGNEVIFDNYQPLPVLIEHIKQVKDKVVALGHPDVPVFTSDLLSAVKPPITNNEDIAGVNLHPFFSGINIEGAADWFWRYYNDNVIRDVGNATKPIWITEVGWPTFPAADFTSGSIPSVENLQMFIDTWLCKANELKLPYYFFEFFDAPWKIWPGSPVEGFWGIMTIDKKLKVKLPDCLAD